MEPVDLAVQAAKKAGALIIGLQGNVDVRLKEHESMVTSADEAAEKCIIGMIHEQFPGHSIIAEESGKSGNAEWKWIIDPLDGTTNFVYGLPWFGVSIALARDNDVQLGVVYFPVANELFVAERGKGATKNGVPISVSSRKNLNNCLALYDASFHRDRKRMVEGLSRLNEQLYRVRLLGVASMQFALIAQGCAEVYVEHVTTPWDIAAGALLVEEAGGKVTDFEGKSWSPETKRFLASNGEVHEAVLAMLKEKAFKE